MRVLRVFGSDLLALALGFGLSSLSLTVVSAARRVEIAPAVAPTVALLSPNDGQTVAGDVVLSATAGLSTQALQFRVGGSDVGPLITSGACSTTWSTTGFMDGSYAVTVVGVDASGSAATSAPVTVTVENTPLNVSAVQVMAVGPNSAVVVWSTNEPASSGVDYGPAGYSASSFDWHPVTQHSVSIGALLPNMSYHFRVSSQNGVGALATSTDAVFTTLANSGSTPGAPGLAPDPGLGIVPTPKVSPTPAPSETPTPTPTPSPTPTPTPSPTPTPTPKPTPSPTPTPTSTPTPDVVPSAPSSGTATGYVLGSSGKPIPNVKVRLTQGDREIAVTVTDVSGKFVFHNLAPGTYRAVASVPGGTQVLTVTVPALGEAR